MLRTQNEEEMQQMAGMLGRMRCYECSNVPNMNQSQAEERSITIVKRHHLTEKIILNWWIQTQSNRKVSLTPNPIRQTDVCESSLDGSGISKRQSMSDESEHPWKHRKEETKGRSNYLPDARDQRRWTICTEQGDWDSNSQGDWRGRQDS